jgi:hypothetical protein
MKSKFWKTIAVFVVAQGIAFPFACRGQNVTNNGSSSAEPSNTAAANGAPQPGQSVVEIQKELNAMKARIAELEGEMKAAATAATIGAVTAPPIEAALSASEPAAEVSNLPAEVTTKTAPFSESDWTWLNGNPRTVDFPLATKYFTPEFRADINYNIDANHPQDDSLGGSTETFRSDEVQVEQLSFGGDIRIQNVRGRFLTMYGMFATTTPRNDATPIRGQWELADAYRYVSEAWGGYHWNVQHGLNLDAGIFVSYIGLFSYYNFDNWAYQPSYVSSNTPWYFNGIRAQWFPTAKLKIEPWFINGWQSYGRANSKPGLGGQILYRPRPWVSLVSNNYGFGEDAVGFPQRHRLHTDNSVEIKYYDNKSKFIDKSAFSFTADAGCEFGLSGVGPPVENVSCHGDTKPAGYGGVIAPKQYFIGWMAYNRVWFDRDKYAFTYGGGQMSNPGRYLTLLPPINGATAASGTPYFTENPGDPMVAWDTTATFDYMPTQFITFRTEVGYRHSSVPYWSGHGGITPPGGNNGSPADYACANGSSSGIGWAPNNAGLIAAENFCNGGGGGTAANVWFPDLRFDQFVGTFAMMVKF